MEKVTIAVRNNFINKFFHKKAIYSIFCFIHKGSIINVGS